jgi:dynein heavy chain
MSPIGDDFGTRVKMFPSLVNNCTLDYFTEWPEEALIGVGKGQLLENQRELNIENQRDQLVEMFKNVHKSVESKTLDFYE